MTYILNNKDVDVTDTTFDDEIAVVIEAYYIDSGLDLTEKELDDLSNKYQAELYQEHFERLIERGYDQYHREWE